MKTQVMILYNQTSSVLSHIIQWCNLKVLVSILKDVTLIGKLSKNNGLSNVSKLIKG
ncbi:Uncharacterized protein APZ42_029369 [Daphnia magna]|uniref:Uncharacterized protein n=1 Tax=Daphnia magna TaxID=35525 RepID=A0A164PHC6_9CRUS|nr:Uncharacterized protein APZ42_029369 [Daphnia magna]